MNKLAKKDPRRVFNAKTSDNSLTLEIYDAIGADFFGDGITASSISDAIGNGGKFDSIALRLNSPGGDLFEGVAIYNLLKACQKPVNVVVDGLAASAASLIAMAGDTVTMGDGSMMMIHEAMAMAMGFADDMRKMADTLETVSASAADLYVAKTGLPKSTVLDMMKAETWMSAQEAVDNKFATSVSKDAAKVNNAFDLSCFKNTPISLKVQTKEVDGEELVAEDFIYAGNPHDVSTWALPWHFSTEEKTKSHLRDALARWNQEEKIPESHKAEAHAKLIRLCKEHGIQVSEPTNVTDDFNRVDLLRKQLEVNKRK